MTIYTVLARNIVADPLFTVALQQTTALIWMLMIWPLERGSGGGPVLARDVLVLIASGLIYYAAAYWLYLRALQAMPASVAGSFFNLIPVFGVVGPSSCSASA